MLKTVIWIVLSVGAFGAQQTAREIPPKNRTTHTEIEDVLGSGHYSELHPPEVLAASTQRSVVRVVNNSRYTMHFVESGPTPDLHPIPSGGTREMIVSPGDYEIVVKLEGSDALALYRKQTYRSGTKYIFRVH